MKKTKYKDLLKLFFEGHGRETFWMIFFYFLKHSPAWGLPIVIARIIDIASTNIQAKLETVILYTGLLLVWIMQNTFTHRLFAGYQSRIARNVCKDLRIKLCRTLQQLSILYHNRNSLGRMQSKIVRDIEVIEPLPNMLTEIWLNAAITLLVTVITIFVRAPIALAFFIVLVPVCVLVQRRFRDIIKKGNEQYHNTIEGMNSDVHTMMEIIPITRAHGLEEKELSHIAEKITEVAKKGVEVDSVNARFGSTSWVVLMTFQMCFLMGSLFLKSRGMITVGDIVMFNSFFGGLSHAFNAFLNMVPAMSKMNESLNSIKEILDAPDLEFNQDKQKVSLIRGEFEFRNVYFSYPGTKRSAIRDVNFKVSPGQSVAFVGPSGCGKSTILYLLLGFLRPLSGKVFFDGKDMNDLDLRTYRNFVGVVTQDIIFFSGTIKDNVAYGMNEATREDVMHALDLANAMEFVEKLPFGMDTPLGERGISLSRGQKQRIAIARALIRSPQVLILDEATSALDVESEKLVQQSLDRMMNKQTTFIVTHRLSTIKNADLIAVMEMGRIAKIGTHDEVMSSANFYSRALKV